MQEVGTLPVNNIQHHLSKLVFYYVQALVISGHSTTFAPISSGCFLRETSHCAHTDMHTLLYCLPQSQWAEFCFMKIND